MAFHRNRPVRENLEWSFPPQKIVKTSWLLVATVQCFVTHMNLAALFIKRPITTTLLVLGVLVFGAMAYRQLPVSDLPTIDFPTIQVNAGLPGASPETMASAAALPLEKQFT